MTASAQGRDVSAYQGAVDWAAFRQGLSFAWCKATNGTAITDPRFTANWAGIRAAGLWRGAYHELTPGDPAGQAAFFLATVRAAGLLPGDMLACVASDYPGVTGAQVKTFCDTVAAAAGPRCPVLVYSDLNMLPSLAGCTGYDLWIAWPSATAPVSVAPWKTWRFWQWGQPAGIDADAFNGTSADLDAWIAPFTAAPKPPAAWEGKLVASLPEISMGSTGQPVRNWQGLLVARGYGYLIAPGTVTPGMSDEQRAGVDGVFGPLTDDATRRFQADHLTADTADGVVSREEWTAALG